MRYSIKGWMWWRPVLGVLGRILAWALFLLFAALIGALLLVALFTKMGY